MTEIDFEPTAEQVEALDKFTTGGSLIIQARAGAGKALADDEPVLTPHGWVAIGDLRVGDQAIARSGLPTRIVATYPQGRRMLHRVVFSDGTTVMADSEHLWTCQTRPERSRHQGWKVRNTDEIADLIEAGGRSSRVFVPNCDPVQGPEADLPIAPWLLGALLGDGTLGSGSVMFSNSDDWMVDRVNTALESFDAQLSHQGGCDYRVVSTRRTTPGHRGFWNGLIDAMSTLDLRHPARGKFIPPAYFAASESQRRALLAGLLDTDGEADGSSCVFHTTSPMLRDGVVRLVQSLGWVATTQSRPCPTYTYRGQTRAGRPAWRVSIRPVGNPFTLPTKASRFVPRSRYLPARRIERIVRSVGEGSATCISVDDPESMFLIAGHVPTHNTSTLQLLAESTGRRGVYLAFNKSISVEAGEKMPSNVSASTIHSMAFRAFGYRYKHRLNSSRMRGDDLARMLGIDPIVINYGQESKRLAPGFLAGHVMKAVERFCQSADDEPTVRHIGYIDGVDIPDTAGNRTYKYNNMIAGELLPSVEKAWADLQRIDGQLPYSHGCYLKSWQISGPQIPADFVLLDEAQDVAPVMYAIFAAQQTAQLIAVGDSAQSIYAFTGAIDAMEAMVADHQSVLSKSFRFGPAVADVANSILGRLDTDPLTGTKSIESIVGPIADPDAVLCRTNATAVREVLAAQREGRRAHLLGGGRDVVAFARAARDLQQRGSTSHPDLACFGSWGEVLDYVDHDVQGGDLRLMVRLIDEFGIETILAVLDNMVPEAQADVLVSTAHKSKGREWPSVRLADDFNRTLPTGEFIPPSGEELRLLYVAVTRAQLELDVEAVRLLSVAGVDENDEKCCPICERTDVVRSNGLIGAHRDCGPTGFDIMAVSS